MACVMYLSHNIAIIKIYIYHITNRAKYHSNVNNKTRHKTERAILLP